MPVKVHSTTEAPRNLTGSWKFKRGSANFHSCQMALVELARALVRANPGGGHFIQSIRIHSSGKDELSMQFMYMPARGEDVSSVEHWNMRYKQFFNERNNALIAYKGHSIATSGVLIQLTPDLSQN